MMSIGALLETEIEEKLEKLATMEPGTDEYKVASDSVMKLLDRAIEMDKIDADRLEREQIRNDERVTKEEATEKVIEEIETKLFEDDFIGTTSGAIEFTQTSASLSEFNEIFLCADACFGDECTLADNLKLLFVLGGNGAYRAVIHAVDNGC